jgi:hypothetical protein
VPSPRNGQFPHELTTIRKAPPANSCKQTNRVLRDATSHLATNGCFNISAAAEFAA